MAQKQKPEVRRRIIAAASEAFAARGYTRTTVADIARRASVAAGNVYRYFPGKEALFAAVVPPEFVARFDELLDRRVAALAGLADLTEFDAAASRSQDDLLAFWIANRLRVVVLLDRSEGTAQADFGARFVDRLVALTAPHLGGPEDAEVVSFILRNVFDGARRTIVSILEHHTAEPAIRRAFAAFWTFQIAGLAGLKEAFPHDH